MSRKRKNPAVFDSSPGSRKWSRSEGSSSVSANDAEPSNLEEYKEQSKRRWDAMIALGRAEEREALGFDDDEDADILNDDNDDEIADDDGDDDGDDVNMGDEVPSANMDDDDVSPNDIQIVNPVSNNRLEEIMNGSNDERQDLETRLSNYTKDQWKELSECLFSYALDATSENRAVMLVFQCFRQIFCHPFTSDYSVVDRIHAIYPYVSTMKTQYARVMKCFGRVHLELQRRRLLNDDTREGRKLNKELTEISCLVSLTFKSLVINRMIQKSSDSSIRSMLEEMTPLTFFKEIDIPSMKKPQQLMHFYLNEAWLNEYKKKGSAIYKPKTNSLGQFVHAFEYMCEVSDFVYHSLYPIEQNQYWFDCLTSGSNVAKTCIDWLTNIKTEYLQDLTQNQRIHAYQNGLFLISHNKFFTFTPVEGRLNINSLNGNLTAIKYHNQQFDYLGMEKDILDLYNKMEAEEPGSGIKSYMAIKMDPIHKILDVQQFTMIEKKWILGFLGRMLHPIGDLDNWGLHIFFLGLGGTGKSTLLRLIAAMLEPSDVGLLNNKVQPMFALESIYESILYLSLDIGKGFSLDQPTWNSMASGEPVSVQRKFKTPVTIEWKSHGGFAGNVLPDWSNDGNSLARRLFVVEYNKVVRTADTELFSKCLKMKDRFLQVATAAYHDLASDYRGKRIKDYMPKRFKESEDKVLKELDALATYVMEYCEVDPTFAVSFTDFNKCWKGFCKKMSIRPKSLNYSLYNGVFAKFQLDVISNPAPGAPFNSKYIKGIKLKANSSELMD